MARASCARRSASTCSFDGLDLATDERMWIEPGSPVNDPDVTTRIGITVAVDQPWRWVVARTAPAHRGVSGFEVCTTTSWVSRRSGAEAASSVGETSDLLASRAPESYPSQCIQ